MKMKVHGKTSLAVLLCALVLASSVFAGSPSSGRNASELRSLSRRSPKVPAAHDGDDFAPHACPGHDHGRGPALDPFLHDPVTKQITASNR